MFARTKWGRDSFPDRALAGLGTWHLLARWADSGWKRPFLKVLCVARADRRDECGWQASVIYLLHSGWFGSGVLDVGFQTNRGGWVTRAPGRNERKKPRRSVSCVGSSANHQEDFFRETPVMLSRPDVSWCSSRVHHKWPCPPLSDMPAFLISHNVLFERGGTVWISSAAVEPCSVLRKGRYWIKFGKLDCSVKEMMHKLLPSSKTVLNLSFTFVF